MQFSKTELRISLLDSFERLLSSLTSFCTSLRNDQPLLAWIYRSETEIDTGISPRTKAVQLFQALWYEDGQDGRDTLTCPGILGSCEHTLKLAQDCNNAKDAFKTAVLALKNLPKAEADTLMLDLHQRDATVAAAMKRMGVARLNLKQAYRHIPLLDSRPVKIGFTWSKQGRTIQRTSVSEARRLLERRRETAQIRTELQRLATVSETETLARVRPVCPHLRANLVFETADDKVERRLMQTPLPLLIPLKRGEQLPEFVPISPEPAGNSRLQRSDVRIDPEVFLPSIRIHRYRPQYRH